MRLRTSVIAAGCVLLAAAAFVVLHSGTLGDAACERSRFVQSTGFSAWPPGAQCAYGEPERTDVILNGWFAAVAGVLVVALAVSRAALSKRR